MVMTYSTSPSPAELRELSTTELGLILLSNLGNQPNVHNMMIGHRQAHEKNRESDIDFLLGRLSDVWAWLVAEGCVGPDPGQSSGWYRVTERGRRLAQEGTLSSLFADQRIPDDIHERLEEARRLFRSGRLELGVFEAMRQVEIALREKSESPNDLIGVPLARRVLHPESGTLTDTRLEKGERQAVADLLAGALGAFKNPTSHRIVDFDDPARSADAIVLADLLLRMLDGSADSDTISEENSGGRS